ncbi:DUF4886 domain-containing protein [Lacihabitans soyangensis]|uniref:DUF4886 domain-containing protein n=1 Tax=Lacihabitans soyangensis TaxID=869394 RepID=A0AAE3H0P3_9BACT|nr:DUF4886 domain-containing protein [Lacihabitans soyangensis]MCP9762522.1 DUF4886 domain-containing protein [Lacihabitans soyangensis]
MKITLLIFTLFSQLSVFAKEQFVNDSIKVLFVGNSLTYYNAMPQLLQKMLNEGEEKVKVEQSTFPGVSLQTHLTWMQSYGEVNGIDRENGNIFLTKQIINQSNWNYIILQQGSVSYLIPEYVEKSLEPAIKEIVHIFPKKGTKFILFETWTPSVYYPQTYCRAKNTSDYSAPFEEFCSPKIESEAQEIALIAESCKKIAESNQMILSQNGELFYLFKLKYPEIKLTDEEAHPTKAGAFLNACVFYELFANKKAKELEFLGDLDIKTAAKIKKFVSETKL